MIDNDNDGERELVLGNKQLLGIFFVATLLCGVFFAMGYVVGGNSAKSAAAASGDSAATPAGGQRDEPSALQPAQQTTAASQPATYMGANPIGGDSGTQVPSPEPVLKDNPAAAQPPARAPVAAVPPPPAPVSKTAPAPLPAALPATNTEAIVYISVPEKGARYWQVTAQQRPAADALVQSLRDRHLPAILAESSAPKLYEVLVGPYRSDITLADAKKKLTEIGGFDGLIPRKF
jgi:cell division septation protein DedD